MTVFTTFSVLGNENITVMQSEQLNKSQNELLNEPLIAINNSKIANISILNTTFYTNIEYSKLFRIDNLIYPEKINATIYYNLSSNDYHFDYFYENSFTAEINKYKTSDTGYLMLEQAGNYTLCGWIREYTNSLSIFNTFNTPNTPNTLNTPNIFSYTINPVCKEIIVLDTNTVECDVSLDLNLDKKDGKYYYSEETLELNFEVNEIISPYETNFSYPSFPYFIIYNIQDFFGNTIRKNNITGKTSNTKLKPDKVLDIYFIDAFIYPACNDTNLFNNNVSKEIIVINNSTAINNPNKINNTNNTGKSANSINQGANSLIKIDSVYDSNNIEFGDSLRIKLKLLKINTSKSSIQSYVIDNDNKKVSEITKFSIFGDDIFQEMSIYIKLKDECKSSGIYYVVVEGLSAADKMPVQIACNKNNNQQNEDDEDKLSGTKEAKEKETATKKSSSAKKTSKKKLPTSLNPSKAAFNESLYQINSLNNLELTTNLSHSALLNTQSTATNTTSQLVFQGTQAKIKSNIKWFLIFMLGLNLVFLVMKKQ